MLYLLVAALMLRQGPSWQPRRDVPLCTADPAYPCGYLALLPSEPQD